MSDGGAAVTSNLPACNAMWKFVNVNNTPGEIFYSLVSDHHVVMSLMRKFVFFEVKTKRNHERIMKNCGNSSAETVRNYFHTIFVTIVRIIKNLYKRWKLNDLKKLKNFVTTLNETEWQLSKVWKYHNICTKEELSYSIKQKYGISTILLQKGVLVISC